jgi:hypothetical protein
MIGGSIKRVALWGAAGLVLAAMLLVPALLAGVRMFAVQTPSMGQVAPVGTLVITTPQQAYVAGDVITFATGHVSHTHRIVRVQADGTFITKGDLNGSEDPLPTAPAHVIGKVTVILPGFGWLIEGLPWLLVGTLGVYLLTMIGKMPHYRQSALRILGTTLVFSLVVLWLRPWLNINMLGFTPAPDGRGVLMHVVNTGLFPLDALGTRLVSGQDGVVQVIDAAAGGRYLLTPTPALDWWQIALLGLVCLGPLIASLLIRIEETSGARHRQIHPPVATVVAIVLATTFVVIGFTMPKAFAAVTASVKTTSNTAGVNAFFNCRSAISSLGANKTFLAFALGSRNATGETDLSGNNHGGHYLESTATSATNVGCGDDTPARSVTFNGMSQCLYMNSDTGTSQTTPNTFSVEAWFKTSSKSNGKIIGFGNSRTTAADTVMDRHIYLDKDGRIVFGVYPGSIKIVYTPAGTNYADGKWHHVVATLSPTATTGAGGVHKGQALYVDGDLVMANDTVTEAETSTAWWKVGCGNLNNWQNADASPYTGPSYFTGQIQYAAVYTVALSADQVMEHYSAG